jgi:hypothetical protein
MGVGRGTGWTYNTGVAVSYSVCPIMVSYYASLAFVPSLPPLALDFDSPVLTSGTCIYDTRVLLRSLPSNARNAPSLPYFKPSKSLNKEAATPSKRIQGGTVQ